MAVLSKKAQKSGKTVISDLRQLALDEPYFGRFLDKAIEIVKPLSLKELQAEFAEFNAGCLQTYHANIRG